MLAWCKALRRKWLRRWHGHTHGWLVHGLYARWHRHCQRRWRGRETDSRERSLFQRDGFVVLPPVPISPALVDGAMAQRRIHLQPGLDRLPDGLSVLPSLETIFTPELVALLESYFQSHFKIYGISVYRTTPTTEPPRGSFLWHLDNCPRQELKVMLYLDDVTARTGAFQIKTRDVTRAFVQAGFGERTRTAHLQDDLDSPYTTYTLEGVAGTRIVFLNGQCLHRGVFPLEAHRDVATFIIIPSDMPWDVHAARHRHWLNTNSGYCVNPWTDQPHSIGYTD